MLYLSCLKHGKTHYLQIAEQDGCNKRVAGQGQARQDSGLQKPRGTNQMSWRPVPRFDHSWLLLTCYDIGLHSPRINGNCSQKPATDGGHPRARPWQSQRIAARVGQLTQLELAGIKGEQLPVAHQLLCCLLAASCPCRPCPVGHAPCSAVGSQDLHPTTLVEAKPCLNQPARKCGSRKNLGALPQSWNLGAQASESRI